MSAELKLERTLEQWALSDPKFMAKQSPAAIMCALQDAKRDIEALHRALEKARAALPVRNHVEDARRMVREAVADGWIPAPKVATMAMKNAGWREIERQGIDPELCEMQPIYYAMLAAAPSPSREGE